MCFGRGKSESVSELYSQKIRTISRGSLFKFTKIKMLMCQLLRCSSSKYQNFHSRLFILMFKIYLTGRKLWIIKLKAFWFCYPFLPWINRTFYYFRVCMKYIDQAMERLKNRTSSSDDDLSLIERILLTESDPNLACVLALDLILVGIDTVSTCITIRKL